MTLGTKILQRQRIENPCGAAGLDHEDRVDMEHALRCDGTEMFLPSNMNLPCEGQGQEHAWSTCWLEAAIVGAFYMKKGVNCPPAVVPSKEPDIHRVTIELFFRAQE